MNIEENFLNSSFLFRRTLLNDELSVSLLPSNSTEKQLLTFKWPDQIFYFLNEEVANLNRELEKISQCKSNDQIQVKVVISANEKNFHKLLEIIKICAILSK